METRPPANRPVWPFILAAVLLLLLIVIVTRSCTRQYGDTPPVSSDTLDNEMTTDSLMGTEGYPDTTDAVNGDDAGDTDRMDGATDTDTIRVNDVNEMDDTAETPQIPPGPPAAIGTPGGAPSP